MFYIHVVKHHAGDIMVNKCNATRHMDIISKANQFWLCSKIPRLQIDVLTNRLKIMFFL